MGKKDRGGQSADYVLSLFDTWEYKARHVYENYFEAGIDKGRRWKGKPHWRFKGSVSGES